MTDTDGVRSRIERERAAHGERQAQADRDRAAGEKAAAESAQRAAADARAEIPHVQEAIEVLRAEDDGRGRHATGSTNRADVFLVPNARVERLRTTGKGFFESTGRLKAWTFMLSLRSTVDVVVPHNPKKPLSIIVRGIVDIEVGSPDTRRDGTLDQLAEAGTVEYVEVAKIFAALTDAIVAYIGGLTDTR